MPVLVDNALINRVTAALQPFADLLETSDYEDAPGDEVVRSAGTLGRDYSFITVADLRRARDLLAELS